MNVKLDLPFVDTRADQLRFSLRPQAQDVLCARELRLGDCTIHLRVLGASHQVEVRSGTRELFETVACHAQESDLLPQQAFNDDYRFEHLTMRYTSMAQFGDKVDAILAAWSEDPCSVVATFGDDRLALTGLRAHETADGVGWSTFHCYPQTAEIVATTSTWRAR